jgi:hypothetical protein
LVPLLRELERQGSEGKLTTATQLSRAVNREFDSVRTFLEAYLAKHSELASKS